MLTRLMTAAALAAGLAIAAPAAAQPPWSGWGRSPNGTYDPQRAAYDNGYRDGLSNGERDVRANRRPDLNDIDDYRDGDGGYDRRYGSKGQYRRYYREGFEQGYREAFYGRGGRAIPRDPGYGRYPNSSRYPDGRYGGYGYYSPAYDKGYSDGYEKGLDDGRDGDRFDPVRQKWYREGDRGYNNRYGSKDAYENAYRDAFRQGYEQGYRDGNRGYRDSRGGRGRGFPWPF